MNFARAQAKNQIPKYVRIAFRSFFDLEATTRMMKLTISTNMIETNYIFSFAGCQKILSQGSFLVTSK